MDNNLNQVIKTKKTKSKLGMIIALLVVIIIALIVVIVRLSLEVKSLKQQIPIATMDVKELDKIENEINKKYVEKDYVLADKNILVEIENKSDYGANADIKVELLDNDKNIIDVIDVYISGIKPNGTGYGIASMWDGNYASYKVTTKLLPASTLRFHTDDITIINSNVSEDSYIIEYKNKASETIDALEIGVLFYDKKNKIIAYSSNIESDIESESTSSMKIRMPINDEYENISYAKAKPIVISAYTYGES